MALELSQAELLDFLCQSGGRVANAALVGHFRRFLRDPEAGPEELQRRRDQFKGFVNSVATVKTEGTGPAAKYVVLRKRYRELVGEEGKAPPDQCRRAALHHPGGEELGCRASSAQPKGGQPGKEAPLGPRLPYIGPPAPQREKQPPRELNGTLPEASLGLRGLAPVSEGLILPVSGMGQGGTQQRIQDWVATHHSPTETIPSVTTLHSPIATNSCPTLDPISFPIIEMGAPPSQGGTQQRIQDWVATHHSPTETIPSVTTHHSPIATNSCPTLDPIAFPVLEMGAPPSQGGITQQRIQDWVATHHSPTETIPSVTTHHSPIATNSCPTLDPIAFPVLEMGAPPSQGGITQQRIQDWMATHPAPDSDNASSLTSGLHRASRDPLPVFRSIRCQLSLQDLEDFIEKESSASEEGSSASGGSDSHRTEGDTGSPLPRLGVRSRIEATRTTGPKGPNTKPYDNGPRGMPPPAKQNGTIPGHLVSVPQSVQGNKPRGKEAEQPNADLPKAKKIARAPPPPNLDALLSPQLVSKQGRATNKPDLDRLAPDIDEHRSSLVPLEPREHAWLVKVATGSWMQARALLLEDPYLATRKDFISGYTVLHWLAKHGNVQVLLDVVTGAKKAGVPLDVNVKSGCGYTPLHLAAMHGHQLVIKVLVQKLQCHVQVRDGSGKRPWQYLSSATSGEVWQLLGAPRGKTIFPARPITRPNNNSLARKGKSPELGRKISRTASLAAYLKPQHIKWKRGNKCPPLHEREEYSD
uniref:Sosondowah ankyrin repeat domain family member B n=1 Tax=Anolis carolinensis TaxID=28377 RepID=G1KMB9_ANOCA|nr:PREDICTED: ankyrin repeat domain-containing protein SOWAHB isoform X1 [Anolis carolinensis]|eukprot:XP_003221893.1 PREDICTED: ankyrin repeat domain-containing protein SOWAHB isoform X1 [Anolis carolinensis]